jgi:hypothetical protein
MDSSPSWETACRSNTEKLPKVLYKPKYKRSGGRSVGIVRSRTRTMEFSLVLV